MSAPVGGTPREDKRLCHHLAHAERNCAGGTHQREIDASKASRTSHPIALGSDK
jgi:hypothetical protein